MELMEQQVQMAIMVQVEDLDRMDLAQIQVLNKEAVAAAQTQILGEQTEVMEVMEDPLVEIVVVIQEVMVLVELTLAEPEETPEVDQVQLQIAVGEMGVTEPQAWDMQLPL
jgi:cell division protein FtsX